MGKRDIDFAIEKARAEHIDEITGIEKSSFAVPWSKGSFTDEITANDLAVYICAIAGGRVVGYIGMWDICGEGHVTNLAVHPDFRNKGVGSGLVEGLIEEAKKRGIRSMTLEVRKSNLAAQALYKKFGFAAAGVRKRYYEDNGEDAVIMWKHGL